jgi:hypothetical protein
MSTLTRPSEQAVAAPDGHSGRIAHSPKLATAVLLPRHSIPHPGGVEPPFTTPPRVTTNKPNRHVTHAVPCCVGPRTPILLSENHAGHRSVPNPERLVPNPETPDRGAYGRRAGDHVAEGLAAWTRKPEARRRLTDQDRRTRSPSDARARPPTHLRLFVAIGWRRHETVASDDGPRLDLGYRTHTRISAIRTWIA